MPFSVNREGSNLRTLPSKNDLQISGSTSGSSPINYRIKKKGKIMHPCHSRQLGSWAEHLQMFTLIKDITEIQLHCKSIISIIATWMLHFTCVYYKSSYTFVLANVLHPKSFEFVNWLVFQNEHQINYYILGLIKSYKTVHALLLR